MTNKLPRNKVEIISYEDSIGDLPSLPVHIVEEVIIDGTPVLVANNGVKLTASPDDLTVLTLTILPSEVIFSLKPRPKDEEENK